MKALSIMLKPASSSCNMRCKYCFYRDEAQHRNTENRGFMTEATARSLIEKAFSCGASKVFFVFQGGEPTLRGLDFFKFFTQTVNQLKCDTEVQMALQTNGYELNADWADFFKDNSFLVGLSVDGLQAVHDKYRVTAQNEGSFNSVLHTAELFDRHGVTYNVLSTVTADVARNIAAIYESYLARGWNYQQYIACLEPIGSRGTPNAYSLTTAVYGEFLKTLFDLWYKDITHGKEVSIRYFDNLVTVLMGHRAEICGMAGSCSYQYVIEGDGTVYPCDFYALDGYELGNVTEHNFDYFDKRRLEIGFIEKSREVALSCRGCKYAMLCRGGCRRERDGFDGAQLHGNRLCAAYRSFFDYALPRLLKLAAFFGGQNG